jgi:hypothetical protein
MLNVHLSQKRYNKFLIEKSAPVLFKAHPRVGVCGLFQFIFKGEVPFAFGFGINEHNDKIPIYSTKKHTKVSACHHKESELKVLIWLHQNNYIDLSLCCLEDIKEPTFCCDTIKPTINAIKKVVDVFHTCYITGNIDIIQYKSLYFDITPLQNDMYIVKKNDS